MPENQAAEAGTQPTTGQIYATDNIAFVNSGQRVYDVCRDDDAVISSRRRRRST